MTFKKKYLLLTFFFIVVFNIFLYTNNKQNTSLRFLKWSVKEVSIGKLINISFFSGLFISTALNSTMYFQKKINYENIEENYIPLDNDDDIKSNVEMPPQRDIRDAQPTISVNYRVIRNTEKNNFKSDQNFSNSFGDNDDRNSNDNDW